MAYEVPPLPYDLRRARAAHRRADDAAPSRQAPPGVRRQRQRALEGTEWADRPIEEVLQHLDSLPEDKRMAVRNNGGGHYNHSLFWELMSPDGGGAARRRASRDAIDQAFDGVGRALKQQVYEAGVNRFGSGWTWLVVAARLASVGRPRTRTRRSWMGRRRSSGSTSGSTPYYLEVPEPPSRLPAAWWDGRQLGGGASATRP